jgi:hypothetical protein
MRRRMALATVGLLLAAGCGSAQEPAPSSAAPAAAGAPIVLPLTTDWLTAGIRLSVTLGGGDPIEMVVDTGSNGVVVSRRALGPRAQSLQPRSYFKDFTYSSSGNHYSGEWMTVPLTLAPVGGGPGATTVPMLVRAVDTECLAGKPCTQDPVVAMLGVGFDRWQDGTQPVDPHAGPSLNPFLQVQSMVNGGLTSGYTIGGGTIGLGVDPADAGSYQTVSLKATTNPVDWQAPTACLSVSGSVQNLCGSLLVDTGLSYAIVEAPQTQQPQLVAGGADKRPVLAPGQSVTVTLGSTTFYQFTVGQSGAPESVQWGNDLSTHLGQPFMNVSRYALSNSTYRYDATNGTVGFRSNS